MSLKEKYLEEMIEKQIKDCDDKYKLSISDMKRILKYINYSIFDLNQCCLWSGYITNNKGKYINFYFNKKKIAIHRLLYLNFVDNLYENQYLTYTCCNKGTCCNLNHIIVKKKIIKKQIKENKNNNNIVYFD